MDGQATNSHIPLFQDIPDPRARHRQFRMIDLFVIAAMAGICDAQNRAYVATFPSILPMAGLKPATKGRNSEAQNQPVIYLVITSTFPVNNCFGTNFRRSHATSQLISPRRCEFAAPPWLRPPFGAGSAWLFHEGRERQAAPPAVEAHVLAAVLMFHYFVFMKRP